MSQSSKFTIYRIFLILALIVVVVFLTGCWGRTEINDIAFVMASGIDLEENGLYRASVQVALPGQMGGATGGGGGTSGEKSYYVDSATGRTLREAVDKIQARMPRSLFFAHRRVVVVGEQLAKKKGVIPLFDTLSRVPENRLTAYLIVAKGSAYDMLNVQPKFERFSGEAIRELAKAKSVIPLNLKIIAQATSQIGVDAIAPYMALKRPEKSGEPPQEVELLGYAQFREGKMVGALQDEQAYGLQWLMNEIQTRTLTMQSGENRKLTLTVRQGSVSITPIITGGHVHIRMNIKAEADMLEDFNDGDLSEPRNVDSVEADLAAHIRAEVNSAFRAIKQRKADSAAFGFRVYRKYPRIWEDRLEQEWNNNVLPATTMSVTVVAKIRSVGMISKNIAEKDEAK